MRTLRYIVLLLLGAALALSVSSRALAHPKLISTEPAAGATLDASPPQLRMVFGEPLERAFSRLELYNAQRQRAVRAVGGLSLNDPTVLELTLPPLAAGVYTVVWQTVGADGHKVQGNFAFTVRDSSATATATSASTGMATQAQPTAAPSVAVPAPTTTSEPAMIASPNQGMLALLASLRAAMLLGVVGLVGGWAVYGEVVQPALALAAPEALPSAAHRWRWLARTLLLLLFAGILAMLLAYTLDLAGSLDMAALLTVLGQTSYGSALAARLGMLLLLIALRPDAAPSSGWRGTAISLFSAGMLLTWSLSGHAAAQPAPLLPMLADWLHLAASALWVGGLLALALLLLPALRVLPREAQLHALAAATRQFSPLALLSVLVLTVSGSYAALSHLAAWSDLWTSAYGWALSLKLLCFGGLLVLGAYNLLVVRPRFESWAQRLADAALALRWRERFAWALRGELLLALIALGAAGWLGSLAPPTDLRQAADSPTQPPTTAISPTASAPQQQPAVVAPTPVPSRPFDQTQAVADLRIRLQVAPASINANSFTVEVRNADGALLDVQLVRLTCAMAEMDMGSSKVTLDPQSQGRYQATASSLSMVGSWQVQVLVRRVDAPDASADFVVPVGQ